MNSLRDILILVFLLGSSVISFGSHVTSQTGESNNNHHQHAGASGLERILNAVHAPESFGYGQNTGSISNQNIDYGSFQNSGYSYTQPNHHQGSFNYNNNGYQYIPPNLNGDGYRYENPSEAQKVIGLDYRSHYVDNNKKTGPYSGYQTSAEHKLSNSATHQGQSSNSGYHYEAPAENYYADYQPASQEIGYNYDKPKYTSSFSSNFKGDSYLPQAQSSSHNSYQNGLNQGYQGQTHGTASVDGYQYESPKFSGYNYYKPQQSGQTQSSFKGQSYLPTPPTPTSSYLKDPLSQGYSYEKPSTSFKGQSYLPLPKTSISSGW